MTILKGPADADNYRVKVGRYGDRWYADPLEADNAWPATPDDAAYPSISTVKKAAGADWTYVALKRVAQHEGQLPREYDARYAALKNINDLGLKKAQQRGTGVHLIAESRLTGFVDPMASVNVDAELYRSAVDAFFDTYQPELVACEFVAFHRDLNGVGYGGTGDAVVKIDGKKYLIDWKSRGEDSDHGAYPEEAAQVAAYAKAQYWILELPYQRAAESGTLLMRTSPPGPGTPLDGGLIVSIKPDGFRVYPVDLDKGFEHWTAMHAWWCARRDERKAVGRPWAPRKVETCQPSTPTNSSASLTSSTGSPVSGSTEASTSSEPSTPTTSSAQHASSSESPKRMETIRQRIRSLPDDVRATHLKRLWPHDVPRGPNNRFTDEQLTRIAAVLDTVEWEYTTKDLEWPGSTAPSAAPTTSSSIPAWQPPEEGPDVDLTDLKARVNGLPPEHRAILDATLKQSMEAKRSFHLKKPSLRRSLIVGALLDVVDASDGDEELIRLALQFAMGEEVQPAVTLGCAFGSLTAGEAEKLSLLALALKAGTAHITFDEANLPQFEGAGVP